MANLLDKFSAKFADTKSRTVIILVGFIIVLALVVTFINKKSKESNFNQDLTKANISNLADNISSDPADIGSNVSAKYTKLQLEDNQQRAEKAQKTGTSAVPTILASQVVNVDSAAEARKRELDKLAQEREAAYQRILAQRRNEAALAGQQQSQAGVAAAQSAAQEASASAMNTAASALLAQWAVVPQQVYQEGSPVSSSDSDSNNAKGSGNTTGSASTGALYKAGDIIYAVAVTAVNSDEPGPVIAKIVQGPLKDSKIIGNLTVVGKKLQLNFTTLNMPSANQSLQFNATAVDAETARTAIATSVDNHYLIRYGSLLGSAFLEGMSNAVLASLQNKGIREGNNVTVEAIRSTSREQVIAGLGNVGSKIASQTDLSQTKPTIKIAAGTGFGLLFMQDFSLNNSELLGGGSGQASSN